MASDRFNIDDLLNPRHNPTAKLSEDELLLIDWVLSVYSHTIPYESNDESLRLLRLRVWETIDVINPASASNSNCVVPFQTDQEEATMLLAVLTTTYRWGTGPDCGYSLKRKLSCFLMGKEYQNQETLGSNQNPESIVNQD